MLVNMETDFNYTATSGCFGIGLRYRGNNDPHVCMVFLTGDDGNWFTVDKHSIFSTFWLRSMKDVMGRIEEWITTNCDPEPSGFGHVFKT